jgi:hypothetical protein
MREQVTKACRHSQSELDVEVAFLGFSGAEKEIVECFEEHLQEWKEFLV